MATVGGVEPFACVSLTCVHQKGLFARVASEIIVASPFPRYLLLTGANFFFFFSYFSSLSYDITLAPHSGNFIGTQEGDQETAPPNQTRGGVCVCRPGDGYTPIYQPMLHRAEGARCVLIPWVEQDGVVWKHGEIQLPGVEIVCSSFVPFKHSLLPPTPTSSGCVSPVPPSRLCLGFSGKWVYCKISRL